MNCASGRQCESGETGKVLAPQQRLLQRQLVWLDVRVPTHNYNERRIF